MAELESIQSAVHRIQPNNALHTYRPNATERATREFLKKFNGKVLYAVKTNPEEHILKHLYSIGVKAFDVASLEEVKKVHALFPEAEMNFMHTIKSRHAIKASYSDFGVRIFSLDSEDELQKILDETNNATDLGLYVRLAIPNTYSEINLSEKFGVSLKDAVALVRKTREKAKVLGICFHVGSQCMHSDAYRIAMRMAAKVIKEAKVKIDVLDVGGGFPSIYPGMTPPPVQTYFDTIHAEFKKIKGSSEMQLMCEPGRALVAESSSVVVRVELRKGEKLYINDGTYGSLFDAGTPGFIFPVRLMREEHSSNVSPFSFYGPTCDTLDFMKGPFHLPDDVKEGDYIEIGQLGAYGRTLSSHFNGFGSEKGVVFVDDEPLMTLYDGDNKEEHEPLEIVAA